MNWDILMKQARDCHTKQAWEQFFDETGEILATSRHAKPIEDIFKILRQDPQSLLYDPRIWGRLIQGCLSSWSLELGHEITEFTKKINSPKLSIPTAQLFLESGSPTIAREIANRTLRLSSLPPAERLQLAMIVVSCYAEEGKREKSIRLLSEIQESLQSPSLDARERADGGAQPARSRYQVVPALGLLWKWHELHKAALRTRRERAPCGLGCERLVAVGDRHRVSFAAPFSGHHDGHVRNGRAETPKLEINRQARGRSIAPFIRQELLHHVRAELIVGGDHIRGSIHVKWFVAKQVVCPSTHGKRLLVLVAVHRFQHKIRGA